MLSHPWPPLPRCFEASFQRQRADSLRAPVALSLEIEITAEPQGDPPTHDPTPTQTDENPTPMQ